MAKITYEVKCENVPRDYESILRTYDWICNASNQLDAKVKDTEVIIDFAIDKAAYSVRSIDEFKEIAFGHDVKVVSLAVFINTESDESYPGIYCTISYISPHDTDCNLAVSSENKSLLIALVEQLKLYRTGEIEKSFPDNQIQPLDTINGPITNYVAFIDQKPSKSIWSTVGEGILKNIAWLIIGAIVLATLALFGIQRPTWLNF